MSRRLELMELKAVAVAKGRLFRWPFFRFGLWVLMGSSVPCWGDSVQIKFRRDCKADRTYPFAGCRLKDARNQLAGVSVNRARKSSAVQKNRRSKYSRRRVAMSRSI